MSDRYQVRCPNCHALQFLAQAAWEPVAIDEATLAIKCWRRTCKLVQGWRVAREVAQPVAGDLGAIAMSGNGQTDGAGHRVYEVIQ